MADQTDSNYENTVREMIRHEDNNINMRMNWLGSLNGLFMATLGFAWGRPDSKNLVTVVCCLGFCVCVTSLCTLVAASRAMARLRQWWVDHRPGGYTGPGVVGIMPDGPKLWRNPGDYFSMWDIIPILLAVAWVAIFWINMARKSPSPESPRQGTSLPSSIEPSQTHLETDQRGRGRSSRAGYECRGVLPLRIGIA